jgi:hypothetical protein
MPALPTHVCKGLFYLEHITLLPSSDKHSHHALFRSSARRCLVLVVVRDEVAYRILVAGGDTRAAAARAGRRGSAQIWASRCTRFGACMCNATCHAGSYTCEIRNIRICLCMLPCFTIAHGDINVTEPWLSEK